MRFGYESDCVEVAMIFRCFGARVRSSKLES
jgi:hypothetical protein